MNAGRSLFLRQLRQLLGADSTTLEWEGTGEMSFQITIAPLRPVSFECTTAKGVD